MKYFGWSLWIWQVYVCSRFQYSYMSFKSIPKNKKYFLSLRVRMWSKCSQVEIRRLKWNCLWIREGKWRYWIFAGSLRWQLRVWVCVCVCVCVHERERKIWEEQLMSGTMSQKLKGQTAIMGPACYWFQARNPFHWRLCPQNHQVFKCSSTGGGFYFPGMKSGVPSSGLKWPYSVSTREECLLQRHVTLQPLHE